MTTHRTRTVTADKIVTVETVVTVEDRVVDFNDILECFKVEYDDEYRTPWEDCDGYDHETVRVDSYEYAGRNNLAHIDRRGAVLVEFTSRVLADFDEEYEYYRKYGASRQVAAELVARNKRKRMATLIGWLENGWQYYGVTGDYEGYHSSCWGIDDYDYADKDVRAECAHDIASQMEADGFIVDNQPDYSDSRKANYLYRLKHNANMFNTEGR